MERMIPLPITTIFFDLDGTLLPMDQEQFVNQYTHRLAAYMAPYGYDPKLLIKGLWTGTGAMMKNDGAMPNEALFWKIFCPIVGKDALVDLEKFDRFYRTDFQNVKEVCGFAPQAAETVRRLKARGFRVVLATNPLFPAVATESRIRWAGLEPEDFELYTTYEISSYCKPNLAYYQEILDKLGLAAEECAMVGNDTGEDMIAESLGMKTFLLTDCLIRRSDVPLDTWPHGGFAELNQWLNAL